MGMLDLIRGKRLNGSAEDGSAERKALSEFQNPFSRSRCSAVHIHIYNREVMHDNPSYAGEVSMSATVSFKNRSTTGEQELTAKTFEALVEKINTFIKSME